MTSLTNTNIPYRSRCGPQCSARLEFARGVCGISCGALGRRGAHRAPRTAHRAPHPPRTRTPATQRTHKTHKRIRATVVSALEAQLERLDVLLGGGGAVSVYLLFAPFPPNKRRTLQLPHIP